jgi:hypothetical protein
MPPKPATELTQVESILLSIAARLLAAARRVSEGPSTEAQLSHYNSKVTEEMVSPHTTSHLTYGAGLSCLHG